MGGGHVVVRVGGNVYVGGRVSVVGAYWNLWVASYVPTFPD